MSNRTAITLALLAAGLLIAVGFGAGQLMVDRGDKDSEAKQECEKSISMVYTDQGCMPLGVAVCLAGGGVFVGDRMTGEGVCKSEEDW